MLMKIDMPVRRMLDKEEAATYCHIPKTKFEAVCPVQPTRLHETLGLVWDVKELDRWLDNKAGKQVVLTDEEIAARL